MSGAHLRTHWGPDPGHGGLTQHIGRREDCAGPDCVDDEIKHPCPLCRQAFDGQGWADMDGHATTIPISWWIDEMGNVELKHSEGICPACIANGKGCKRHLEIGFPVHEDCEHMAECLRKLRGVCRACGRTSDLVDLLCDGRPLSYTEWFAHRDDVMQGLERKGVERREATFRANEATFDRFGPCPEKS